VKGEWITHKLGEVIKLEYGKPLPKEDRTEDGAYPAYGANGVKCRTNRSYWDKPSIVVGRKGSAGELTLTEPSFWPLDVSYFITFDEESFDLMFLYYCLSGLNLQSLAKGVKPGINRNDVYAIERAFPPLPEQQQIVAILDKAFAAIDQAVANAERNLTNARELFESYLNKVFTERGEGWVEATIDEIAQVKGGKRLPKGYKLQGEETDHPYITVSDFNDEGTVDLEGVRYITDEIFEQISRYTISAADVYISIAGTIGKSGIVPEEMSGANLTENACKLVLKGGVDNRFVYYFTKTSLFSEQAIKQTRIAAQPKLALTRLKSIRLAVPPMNEQLIVIHQAELLNKETKQLETIYQQKLTALTELKQSILQKAFRGELTAGDSYG